MVSAKKNSEILCNKCIKQTKCEYKQTDNSLVLLRCVDYTVKENNGEEK